VYVDSIMDQAMAENWNPGTEREQECSHDRRFNGAKSIKQFVPWSCACCDVSKTTGSQSGQDSWAQSCDDINDDEKPGSTSILLTPPKRKPRTRQLRVDAVEDPEESVLALRELVVDTLAASLSAQVVPNGKKFVAFPML